MANPQKENGHTEIANEILEALFKFDLNGTELKIVLFVLRKTYGWGKKDDEISLSQFCNSLKFTKPSICKALKRLQLVKIILLVGEKGNSKNSSNRYSFNKNYDQWGLVNKPKLVKIRKSTSKGLETQLVNKPLHTKETIQKKLYKRNNTNVSEQVQNEKKEFGNPKINEMLLALKNKIGIEAFVDSRIERNIARHCITLVEKLGATEFVRRLEFLLNDNFHQKNCNKILYVYNHIKGFIEPKSKKESHIF